MEINYNKISFANTFINFNDRMPKGLTECERYGMTWGCDEDCPVFQIKECEIQKENEKEFEKRKKEEEEE